MADCGEWANAISTSHFPAINSEARKLRSFAASIATSVGNWLSFAACPAIPPETPQGWIRTEGLEHYLAAQAKGKGVLVLTGHLGAWELSSFYHSLMGHPMGLVIRRLDNRTLDEFVNGIRCLHGNRVLHKDDFARGLLTAMRAGDTVGILMDTNMTPPQGVFVNFFGLAACTASGLARVALKTGAAVLPGFMLWEPAEQKYVLHFGPELVFAETDNNEADILAATQQCNDVLESWIRRYPDQWLWIHRRWKTRPPGEPKNVLTQPKSSSSTKVSCIPQNDSVILERSALGAPRVSSVG